MKKDIEALAALDHEGMTYAEFNKVGIQGALGGRGCFAQCGCGSLAMLNVAVAADS